MAGAADTLADQTSETESEAGVVVKGQLLATYCYRPSLSSRKFHSLSEQSHLLGKKYLDHVPGRRYFRLQPEQRWGFVRVVFSFQHGIQI